MKVPLTPPLHQGSRSSIVLGVCVYVCVRVHAGEKGRLRPAPAPKLNAAHPQRPRREKFLSVIGKAVPIAYCQNFAIEQSHTDFIPENIEKSVL